MKNMSFENLMYLWERERERGHWIGQPPNNKKKVGVLNQKSMKKEALSLTESESAAFNICIYEVGQKKNKNIRHVHTVTPSAFIFLNFKTQKHLKFWWVVLFFLPIGLASMNIVWKQKQNQISMATLTNLLLPLPHITTLHSGYFSWEKLGEF